MLRSWVSGCLKIIKVIKPKEQWQSNWKNKQTNNGARMWMKNKKAPLFLAKCKASRNVPPFLHSPHLLCTKVSLHSPETWSLIDSSCFVHPFLSLRTKSLSFSEKLIKAIVGEGEALYMPPSIAHMGYAGLILRRPQKPKDHWLHSLRIKETNFFS